MIWLDRQRTYWFAAPDDYRGFCIFGVDLSGPGIKRKSKSPTAGTIPAHASKSPKGGAASVIIGREKKGWAARHDERQQPLGLYIQWTWTLTEDPLNSMLSVIFMSGALAAQTAVTSGDLPLPPPTAIVQIQDVGPADAPARCIGTANAYVKPQPHGEVMTWVEETNLSVKNVSTRDVAKMIVKLNLVDVRGNTTEHIWQLYTPGVILEPGSVRKVGRGRHWGGARPTVPQSDYDSSPEVKPKVECHVDSVFFSDGSAWPDGAVFPEPPLE